MMKSTPLRRCLVGYAEGPAKWVTICPASSLLTAVLQHYPATPVVLKLFEKFQGCEDCCWRFSFCGGESF